jgi:heme-degrading monooxygenase HmoA
VLLHLDPDHRAPFLAVHLTSFHSPWNGLRWRRSAKRRMGSEPGVIFAKAMPFIGSLASGGFGVGVPSVNSQILLTAWASSADFEEFLSSALHGDLVTKATYSGWILCEVALTKGAHHGMTPLVGTGVTDGVFVALTLGRTTPRRLPIFLTEGVRLGSYTHDATGLVAAVSAGFPVTGNCTVSLWRSEADMHAFAYSEAEGHVRTIRRKPPILSEQINARLRLRRLGGDCAPTWPYADRLGALAREVNS